MNPLSPPRAPANQPRPQNPLAGNIDVNRRPRVSNEDGTISTVRSMSIGVDGLEYLIPMVSDDGRMMSEDEAIQAFFTSGRHLGAFKTPDEATAFAKRLHDAQELRYLGHGGPR